MKRFLTFCESLPHRTIGVLLCLGLLAGCAALDPQGKSILKGGSSLVAVTTNPVAPVNIYQAKIVYAGTVELAVAYREYCWKRSYDFLMKDPVAGPVCKSRRSIVRSMQAADDKAYAAIKTADNFVRQNPTLNATGVIGAAIAAVADFQNLASGYAVAVIK